MESKTWFRLYAEFAGDPKVQTMPEDMQRRLVMLLCFRCGNSLEMLGDNELAAALRISAEQLAETKKLFISRGFVDRLWRIQNWNKRQFSSDSSTERSRRHRNVAGTLRERCATVAATGGCNAPESETESETETETETETENSLCMESVQSQKQLRAPEIPAASPHTNSHPANGNGQKQNLAIPSGADWPKICAAATKARMSFNARPDSETCRFRWRPLALPDRIAAIDGIYKRIECGEYDPSQPTFTHTLDNYLAKRIWKQPLRPQTRGAPLKRKVGAAMERLARGAAAND